MLAAKPPGPTSHDVVARIKRERGVKTGHAGTLDPFATGLLVSTIARCAKSLRNADASFSGSSSAARFAAKAPMIASPLRKPKIDGSRATNSSPTSTMVRATEASGCGGPFPDRHCAITKAAPSPLPAASNPAPLSATSKNSTPASSCNVMVAVEPWVVPARGKSPALAIDFFKYLTSRKKARQFVLAKGTLSAVRGTNDEPLPETLRSPAKALREARCLNPRPESVVDEEFTDSEFFDARCSGSRQWEG